MIGFQGQAGGCLGSETRESHGEFSPLLVALKSCASNSGSAHPAALKYKLPARTSVVSPATHGMNCPALGDQTFMGSCSFFILRS